MCKCFGHSLECLLSSIIDITEHTSTLKFGYLGSTAVYITIVGTSFDGALLTGLWEFFKLSCDFDFCVPDGTYRVYKKIITHIKISSSFGVHKIDHSVSQYRILMKDSGTLDPSGRQCKPLPIIQTNND